MEWLSSRVALKKLLMERNLISSPLHCQTEKDRFGRPHITIYKEDSLVSMNCSISHKKGMATAGISWVPNMKIGIDIETISEKPWRLQNAFVGQEDFLSNISESQKYFTVLWACKEAASKAMGLGMATDFKTLKIKGDDTNRFSILDNGEEAMRGIYFFFQNFIVAICVHGLDGYKIF
jgi:phosphopantetheinyl transferase